MPKDCFGIGGAETYRYATIMSAYKYFHILFCTNSTKFHFSSEYSTDYK